MQRMLRAPALHFIVLGGLLYAASSLLGFHPLPVQRDSIVITEEDAKGLWQQWEEQFGVAAGPATRRRILEDAVDEEALYREALALGLDRRVPVIANRLRGLANYVAEDDLGSEGQVASQALEWRGNDLIVRRHLVHLMRSLLASTARSNPVSAADVSAYYDIHRSELMIPERTEFTHVFLRRAHAGQAAPLLQSMRERGTTPSDAATLGDPFIRGARIDPTITSEIAASFGAEFAAELQYAPLGQWSGPYRSAYGSHLVWVSRREEAEMPSPQAVQNRIVHAQLHEHRQQRLRAALTQLRARYQIQLPAL
jgi:hypothetical protein